MKTRVTHTDKKKGWLAAALCLILVFSATGGLATESVWADDGEKWSNPYVVDTFIDDQGREISKVTVPGRPPEVKAAPAALPERHVAGVTLNLSNVPALDWSYGCSATSAAMLFGYYDRTGYSDMYTGPTNGGVFPMPSSPIWGQTSYPGVTCMECPLSATHEGIDGLVDDDLPPKGHVDDYWVYYAHPGPDPYVGNWAEHDYADCTADFMGTSQSKYGNSDGATTFYYNGTGARLVDYTDCEPGDRDGCHGMRLFAESRGYTVVTNYFQLIKGHGSNPALGFTFDMYKSEIDAGRPVLIQVEGHSMLGIGYDDPSTVYLHNTWDYAPHTMTWGGTYSGMQHYAVTAIELAAVSPTVDNSPASDITSTSARLNGEVTSTGGQNPTVHVYWGDEDGETTPGNWDNDEDLGTKGAETFYVDITALDPETPYYYRCYATNSGGDDWADSTESFHTSAIVIDPPPAPTLVSPANGTTVPGSSISFDWSDVGGANKYWIHISADPSFSTLFHSNWWGASGCSYSDFPNDGTTYHWRVKARNAVDNLWGDWCSPWSFTNEGAGPPSPPTLVSPSNGSTVPGTSIAFDWDPVAGANKYWIQVDDDPAFSSLFHSNWWGVSNKTYTDFPDDGTEFYWRVKARNEAGWGDWSSAWSFTNEEPPPSPPTLVSPANGATVPGTSISFDWDPVAGANKYWIQVDDDPAFSSLFHSNWWGASGCSYSDFPADDTEFYWRARARNAAGWGDWSSAWSFTNTAGVPPPPAPTLVSPANGGIASGTSIAFDWDPVAGANKYWIQVDDDPAFSSLFHSNWWGASGCSYSDFPNDGTTYHWRVKARNAAGWGDWCSPWSFTNE